MTEVYALEEEDGTWQPLCKGLFQSNPDTEIREFLCQSGGDTDVLTRMAAFLIGLNVLRNLHVLHHYGGVDVQSEPYVQIVQVRPQPRFLSK